MRYCVSTPSRALPWLVLIGCLVLLFNPSIALVSQSTADLVMKISRFKYHVNWSKVVEQLARSSTVSINDRRARLNRSGV